MEKVERNADATSPRSKASPNPGTASDFSAAIAGETGVENPGLRIKAARREN